MSIKLWHLLTIIDNKDYIDLHVCKVLENEYLCVTCLVLEYITMLCSIIILGVYYVQ